MNMNLQMDHRFKHRAKTIKLLEGNIGGYLHDLGSRQRFQRADTESTNYKEKIKDELIEN